MLFALGLPFAASGCQAGAGVEAGGPGPDAAPSADVSASADPGDTRLANLPDQAGDDGKPTGGGDASPLVDTGTGAGGVDGDGDGGERLSSDDPGTAPWVAVPPDQVMAVCHLDPQRLADADATLKTPWAIVRYGRLCHESAQSTAMAPSEVFSTTKTLGAIVTGAVAYQTRMIRRAGGKTGAFSDEDRVDQWLDKFSYNPEAHVAHVLGMVAQNRDLSLGKKAMQYDALGTVQISTLSDMLNTAIRQDPTRLGADIEQFTRKFVYGALGMTQSTWGGGAPNKNFANSWSTNVHDMARLGLLMLHHGVWSGQRVVAAEWIYRMTHPSFEDSNTGYGYLTWVNSSSNFNYGAIGGLPAGLQQGAQMPGPCAPVSVYPTHPHGLSDAPDCNYAAPYTCDQQFDVGVWQAIGKNGNVIQGHPGLDVVIAAREVTPGGLGPPAARILWEAVRPAIVAGDPKFAGDDAAFCLAYGKNEYAPDLH